MKTEFEITFTQIDKDKIREKIKSLSGICIKENTLMKRVVFEPFSDNKKTYVRVRDEGDKITCTYKETLSGELSINSAKELETTVGDFSQMVEIFRKLGLREKSYQESYRETWEINDEIEIMIDQWPGLKPYIEIEGKNEEVVRKYTKLLGFNWKNGFFSSCFEIYEKELGINFDTMNSMKKITFENPPKK